MKQVSGLRLQLLVTLVIGAADAIAADLSQLPPPAVAPISFVKDIQPILETSCLRCHGALKPKGGLRLDTRDAALRGGAVSGFSQAWSSR